MNPWFTHSRFIFSHTLLHKEEYSNPLCNLLSKNENGEPRTSAEPGSLLILYEAHHAAPASSSRYAIDSPFIRVVRTLAEHFEHRLFLSATPHNGFSNSFSALLEILDPQRFVRGIPVEPKLRDEVMVRRFKMDLREISGAFPKRISIQIPIESLPTENPELEQILEAQRVRIKDDDETHPCTHTTITPRSHPGHGPSHLLLDGLALIDTSNGETLRHTVGTQFIAPFLFSQTTPPILSRKK